MRQEEIILEKGKILQPFFQRFSFESTEKIPTILTVGMDHSPKEYYWNNQQREQMVVFQYTLKGKGYLATKHQIYELKEDTFFLAELPQPFTYYRGEEEWSFIYIEFSKEYLQWLNQSIQIVDTQGSDFLAQLLSLLQPFFSATEDIYDHSSQAYRIFLLIKQRVEQQSKDTLGQAIQNYLEGNYSKDISLDQLAEVFDLSKYKIIRLFEKEYHQTPMNYLRHYRIIQSIRYLSQSKMTIKEIAQLVGFTDVNYFSKVFKKEMGRTPTDYRK